MKNQANGTPDHTKDQLYGATLSIAFSQGLGGTNRSTEHQQLSQGY